MDGVAKSRLYTAITVDGRVGPDSAFNTRQLSYVTGFASITSQRMYSKPLVLLAAVFLLTAAPRPATAAAELVELARAVKPSVVLLSILDRNGRDLGSGTGFFVSADGRIVTNAHVVEPAERMEAELADGRKIPILGILAEDRINDIAILQADFKPAQNQQLALVATTQPAIQPGERVFVIGAPRGLSGTLSEGIVSAIRAAEKLDKFENDPRKGREPLLQITAAISHGSSGSPVLNTQSQVIGVAVAVLGGGQNLNFAVPVSVVHKLLLGIVAGATPRPFKGHSAVWNLLISAALIYGIYWSYKRLCNPTKPEPRGRPTQRY